jgi:hypothetical protein
MAAFPLSNTASGNPTDESHVEYRRGVEAERARVLAIVSGYIRDYLAEERAAGKENGEDSGYPPYHLMVVSELISGWQRG